MHSVDSDDEAYLREQRWGSAVAAWLDGRADDLAALLREQTGDVPAEARSFLADLVSGEVRRGKGGRPVERDGWVERSIVAEVFAEWDRPGGTKADAIAKVAYGRGEPDDAIRGVVDKVRREGLTLDWWRDSGRPDFAKRPGTKNK